MTVSNAQIPATPPSHHELLFQYFESHSQRTSVFYEPKLRIGKTPEAHEEHYGKAEIPFWVEMPNGMFLPCDFWDFSNFSYDRVTHKSSYNLSIRFQTPQGQLHIDLEVFRNQLNSSRAVHEPPSGPSTLITVQRSTYIPAFNTAEYESGPLEPRLPSLPVIISQSAVLESLRKKMRPIDVSGDSRSIQAGLTPDFWRAYELLERTYIRTLEPKNPYAKIDWSRTLRSYIEVFPKVVGITFEVATAQKTKFSDPPTTVHLVDHLGRAIPNCADLLR